jgi:hypothetical protein
MEADMTNSIVRKTLVLTCAALLVISAAAPAFADFFRASSVLAFDTDTWRVWAAAGNRHVVVSGDGDTDLDCYVDDRFGNRLDADTDGTDFCVLDFHNPSSGNLTIRISNLGSVYNEYTLSVR